MTSEQLAIPVSLCNVNYGCIENYFYMLSTFTMIIKKKQKFHAFTYGEVFSTINRSQKNMANYFIFYHYRINWQWGYHFLTTLSSTINLNSLPLDCWNFILSWQGSASNETKCQSRCQGHNSSRRGDQPATKRPQGAGDTRGENCSLEWQHWPMEGSRPECAGNVMGTDSCCVVSKGFMEPHQWYEY